MEHKPILVNIAVDDVIRFKCDVLVLKHAQSLFGADLDVYRRFERKGLMLDLPPIDEFSVAPSQGVIGAQNVLLIGVEPLGDFGYAQIREFGRRAVSTLARHSLSVKHLALTLHGPGFGLDEVESFESELAGIIDAVASEEFPEALSRVTFVEIDSGRANRMRPLLEKLVPSGRLSRSESGKIEGLDQPARMTLRNAGYSAATKKRVFVAMPFAEDMSDVFHYGIQNAVNASSMLAERADLSAFSGDVMQWVKDRIDGAHLLIADLTGANPNVYLEVGFAWGRSVPTVLLARAENQLKFDVRGQRCLIYSSIKDLEEKLSKELLVLTGKRI